jgi:ubiquinone/menaquinone biosynthesis C-methylase UbiE
MGSSGVDTTAAQAYERYLAAPLNGDMAMRLTDLARAAPGNRLLDVACGTGIVARSAAPKVAPGGSMVGVDFDPAMITLAPTLVEKPPGVDLEWHCASAEDLPLPPDSVDIAFCLQGLQYFPDATRCLAEIHRVLKADGRFLGAVWTALEDCKGQHAIAKALQKRDIDVSAIVKAYSFGNPDRVRRLAADAGLRDLDLQCHAFTAGFASTGAFINAFTEGAMSSRAAIAKVPDTEKAAFLDDIERTLAPYANGTGVQLPVRCLVITARK